MIGSSSLSQPLNSQGNIQRGVSSRSFDISRPGKQAYDMLKKSINTLSVEELSQRAFDSIVHKTDNREAAFKEITHLFVKIGENKLFSTPVNEEKGREFISNIINKVDNRFPFETPLSGDLKGLRTACFSNYLKDKVERSKTLHMGHFGKSFTRGYGLGIAITIAIGVTTGGIGFVAGPIIGFGVIAKHAIQSKNSQNSDVALRDVITTLPEEPDPFIIPSPMHGRDSGG